MQRRIIAAVLLQSTQHFISSYEECKQLIQEGEYLRKGSVNHIDAGFAAIFQSLHPMDHFLACSARETESRNLFMSGTITISLCLDEHYYSMSEV